MEATPGSGQHELRHVVSDAPRVMVVDGSKLVRKLIGDTLLKEVPGAEVIGCGGLEDARALLPEGSFLEVFVEVAPALYFVPLVDLHVEGFIGARFYF